MKLTNLSPTKSLKESEVFSTKIYTLSGLSQKANANSLAEKLVAGRLPKQFGILLALSDDIAKMGSQDIHYELEKYSLDKNNHLTASYTFRLTNESDTQILARIHKWEKEVDSSPEAQDLIDHWLYVMEQLSAFFIRIDIGADDNVVTGTFHP